MIGLGQGMILSFGVAFIAYRKGSLAASGFWAALFVGTVIYSAGGLLLWLLLISFFATSTVAGKIRESRMPRQESMQTRGGVRDWVQVFANGAIPVVLSVLYYVTEVPGFLVAFASAIAAANSDTWASEIGALSRKPPISIVTLQPMTPGLSGGVSLLGTGAAGCGALIISLVFVGGLAFLPQLPLIPGPLLLLVALAGFSGSIVDSVLGALWQAKFRCVQCGQVIEMGSHHGEPAQLISGSAFISNDVVNLISSLWAAALAMLWTLQAL